MRGILARQLIIDNVTKGIRRWFEGKSKTGEVGLINAHQVRRGR
jgi:hypothetical protein